VTLGRRTPKGGGFGGAGYQTAATLINSLKTIVSTVDSGQSKYVRRNDLVNNLKRKLEEASHVIEDIRVAKGD
jgi:hypothetical protein